MSHWQAEWYANMLRQDLEDKNEREISTTEYLASFWNAEAVQKMRQVRDERKRHAFLDDDTFEKQLRDEDFKNNELIKAIQKINANNLSKTEAAERSHGKLRRPTSLKELLDDMD